MSAAPSTYVIGDVHGCFDALEALWESIPFRPKRDHLWLTGDLVNRGPKSLEVLRWARRLQQELGLRFAAVLGNHDLHLLAVAEGVSTARRGDTLQGILEAPERGELLSWLNSLPLAHRRDDYLLVHAGVHPSWGPGRTLARARKVRSVLNRPDARELLLARSPNARRMTPKLERRRWELAVLTRMRCLDSKGRLAAYSGAPENAGRGLTPWYSAAARRTAGRVTVITGHWAALGLRLMDDVMTLDSGAAWGGKLTAVRLEDRQIFQVDALETRDSRSGDS